MTLFFEYIISYNEYNDGNIFPKVITRNVYTFENNKKKMYSFSTLTVQNDYEINIELSGNEFVMDFPKGMLVKDKRTGERYEVK